MISYLRPRVAWHLCLGLTLGALFGHAQSQPAGQTATTGAGATTAAASKNWLPPESQFKRVILDEDATINGEKRDTLDNPMELAVAPDGRVFFIDLSGTVKMWKPDTRNSVVIGKVPVFVDRSKGYEDGLLGITLDPKFKENRWIYLNHSLPPTTTDASGKKAGTIRVSRYTLVGEVLDLASEVPILDIPEQRETCCHVGGSIAFDPNGNLYVSVGDNTNPFDSDGFSPSDDRPGKESWDAQRSSANPNALTGKILRVKPRPEGGYDIPPGNLFPPGTPGTRPEIYVMGNRNPFRISIDQKTGFLYWGEVGPDAGSPHPKRGAAGFDEVNQARAAGNFGWPYFIADNKPYARIDFVERKTWRDSVEAYDKAKKAAKDPAEISIPKPGPWPPESFEPVFHDPAHPVNRSKNNTGIQDLPPAQPAFIFYPHAPSTRFPVVGSGGRTAMAGPVYYYDETLKSDRKLPREFHHTLFIYEWTRNWIIAVKLDDNDRIAGMQRFMPSTDFKRPVDLELGPDGALYLLEYGKEWGGSLDSKLVRLEYTPPAAN